MSAHEGAVFGSPPDLDGLGFTDVGFPINVATGNLMPAPVSGDLFGISFFGATASTSGPYSVNWTLDLFVAPAPISPVPVPAAVWLFGTALIGLVGFGKRRKAA